MAGIEISKLFSRGKNKPVQSIFPQNENADPEAQDTRDWFVAVRAGNFTTWRRNSQISYDFSLGDQLTEAERNDLRDAGMPDFIINGITGDIETLKYFINANNPRPIASGNTPDDSNVSFVYNGLFSYTWDRYGGKSVLSQAVRDSLTKSIGYVYLRVDPNADNGLGDVVFEKLDPWCVYVDPASTDPLFRDAARIVIKKDIKETILINKLPQYKEQIKKAATTDEHSYDWSERDPETSLSIQPTDIKSLTVGNTEHRYVDYYERFEKVPVHFVNITIEVVPDQETLDLLSKEATTESQFAIYQIDLDTQEQTILIDEALSKGEMSQKMHDFQLQKLQIASEQQKKQAFETIFAKKVKEASVKSNRSIPKKDYDKLIEDKEIEDSITDVIEFIKPQIKLTVSVGSDTKLYDTMLPLDTYPIIPIPYIYTGTPYPISAVSPVVGLQEEANKAHQIMIYNASLNSNGRWLYQEGSLADPTSFRENSTKPGGEIVYKHGYEPPKFVLPGQINTAFYTIVENALLSISRQIGASAISSGNVPAQDTAYRGLVALDEFGTRRIKSWVADVLDPALDQIGVVWSQLARYLYKTYKVFRIVNPQNNTEEEVSINVPRYDTLGNEIVDRWNDISTHSYDVKFAPGSTLPSDEEQKRMHYFQLFQAGIIDDIMYLDIEDIPHKESLLARKSIYAELSSKLEAMEKELKDRDGTIETLKRQVIQSGIKNDVMNTETELNKMAANHKAALDSEQSKVHEGVKTLLNNMKQQGNKKLDKNSQD